MELNLNNVTILPSGRVAFSGLSTGIDFQAVADAIIAAKRIPADRIALEIDENTTKIAEYQEFRDLLKEIRDTLSTLHGAVSVGNTQNIFEAKAAFASTSRSDGQSPAAAGNLVGLAITNQAALGNHTMEVLNIAKAHKVSGDVVADQTAPTRLCRDVHYQWHDHYRKRHRHAAGHTRPDQQRQHRHVAHESQRKYRHCRKRTELSGPDGGRDRRDDDPCRYVRHGSSEPRCPYRCRRDQKRTANCGVRPLQGRWSARYRSLRVKSDRQCDHASQFSGHDSCVSRLIRHSRKCRDTHDQLYRDGYDHLAKGQDQSGDRQYRG